jgi:CheY-like chemotaxis protein
MTPPPLTKILCVEDEPDIQAIARMALETVGGFTVETCISGKEAVEKAPGFGPDLILLDVMMPGMDGPETLLALRALPGFEALPVIFMTAKAMASEIQKYKDLGALDVIPKPFNPMTLSDQIKAIWSARP